MVEPTHAPCRSRVTAAAPHDARTLVSVTCMDAAVCVFKIFCGGFVWQGGAFLSAALHNSVRRDNSFGACRGGRQHAHESKSRLSI